MGEKHRDWLIEALLFLDLAFFIMCVAKYLHTEANAANTITQNEQPVVSGDSIVSRNEFYTPKYLELDQNTEIWENPEWFDSQDKGGEKLNVRITHYCPCSKCCGKSDGITATGTYATAGRTISVDPKIIPYGSIVFIGGHPYVAEDTGVRGAAIDIYCNSHLEALRRGIYYTEVEVIS